MVVITITIDTPVTFLLLLPQAAIAIYAYMLSCLRMGGGVLALSGIKYHIFHIY